jgi:GNAT superfamily N-acetyltransferase
MSELERVLAYLRDAQQRVCDEVRLVRHGVALMTESLPLLWTLNLIRVEDPDATPDELAEEAEAVQGVLGHRKLTVFDEDLGARLRDGLEERGWNAERLVLMAWRGEPLKSAPDGLAIEADRKTADAALAAFRREQPFGWQEEALRQLAAMDERFTRELGARDFVAPPRAPAATCRLFSNGSGVAQVDEVGTLAAERGRGLASAVVLAAVEAAQAGGHELIFLQTDADDWPRELYARLGFEPIGAIWEFLKLPMGGSPP